MNTGPALINIDVGANDWVKESLQASYIRASSEASY